MGGGELVPGSSTFEPPTTRDEAVPAPAFVPHELAPPPLPALISDFGFHDSDFRLRRPVSLDLRTSAFALWVFTCPFHSQGAAALFPTPTNSPRHFVFRRPLSV